jgi:hypothetical protein
MVDLLSPASYGMKYSYPEFHRSQAHANGKANLLNHRNA